MDEEILTESEAPVTEPAREPVTNAVNGDVKVNGDHQEAEDETDVPLRSPPATAPKPSRESRTSKVFSKLHFLRFQDYY